MAPGSLHKFESLDKQNAASQARSTFVNNDDNLGLPDKQVISDKTKKYSNNKSRVIGLIGAVLIGFMIYTLIANY